MTPNDLFRLASDAPEDLNSGGEFAGKGPGKASFGRDFKDRLTGDEKA